MLYDKIKQNLVSINEPSDEIKKGKENNKNINKLHKY